MDEKYRSLNQVIDQLLTEKKLHLAAKKKQSSALNPISQVQVCKEKFQSYNKGLQTALFLQLQKKRLLVEPKTLRNRLDQKILFDLKTKKESYQRLISHLKGVNPKNLLTKGYCILFSEKNDSVILNAKDVALEQRLRILLQDGQLQVKVEVKL